MTTMLLHLPDCWAGMRDSTRWVTYITKKNLSPITNNVSQHYKSLKSTEILIEFQISRWILWIKGTGMKREVLGRNSLFHGLWGQLHGCTSNREVAGNKERDVQQIMDTHLQSTVPGLLHQPRHQPFAGPPKQRLPWETDGKKLT